MSFRQIFDRINRIARSSSIDLFGERRRFDEELRRAQELIDGERRREEEKRRQKSAGTESNTDTSDSNDPTAMTLRRAATIIGVPVTASLHEIATAYRRRISDIHPDRHTHRSEAEQAQAVARTQQLNEAYAFLKRHHAG